jgi:hypothetical protein
MTINTDQILLGLYHPLAVELITILNNKVKGLYYETIPPFMIGVRRPNGLPVACVGFFGDEIRFRFVRSHAAAVDAMIIASGWEHGNCHAVYSYADPSSGIEEIADRLVWFLELSQR